MMEKKLSRIITVIGLITLIIIGGAVIYGAPGTPCSDRLTFKSPPPEFTLSYNGTDDIVTITYNGDRPLVHYPSEDSSNGKRTYALYVELEREENKRQHKLASSKDRYPITKGQTFKIEPTAFNTAEFNDGDEVALRWNRTQARLPSYCLNQREPSSLTSTVRSVRIEK